MRIPCPTEADGYMYKKQTKKNKPPSFSFPGRKLKRRAVFKELKPKHTSDCWMMLHTLPISIQPAVNWPTVKHVGSTNHCLTWIFWLQIKTRRATLFLFPDSHSALLKVTGNNDVYLRYRLFKLLLSYPIRPPVHSVLLTDQTLL